MIRIAVATSLVLYGCAPRSGNSDRPPSNIAVSADSAAPSAGTQVVDTPVMANAAQTTAGAIPATSECVEELILVTTVPNSPSAQNLTVKLECWDLYTETPLAASYLNDSNDAEWFTLTEISMEPVGEYYPWAAHQLVGSLESENARITIFFTDPTAPTGWLQVLSAPSGLPVFGFDSGRLKWDTAACTEDCNGALSRVDGRCRNLEPPGFWVDGELSCADGCMIDESQCIGPNKSEYETCQIYERSLQGECGAGLVCAQTGPDLYHCLQSCTGIDDVSTCGTGARCVSSIDDNLVSNHSISHVCYQTTLSREARCNAVGPHACRNVLSCHQTKLSHPLAPFDEEHRHCKILCELGERSTCPSGEQCFPDPHASYDCKIDSACRSGFNCREYPWSTEEPCFSGVGVCGEPVAPCTVHGRAIGPPAEPDTMSADSNWRQALHAEAQVCIDANHGCALGLDSQYCDGFMPANPDLSMRLAQCVYINGGVCIALCDDDSECRVGEVCKRPPDYISNLADFGTGFNQAIEYGADSNGRRKNCDLRTRSCPLDVPEGETPYGCIGVFDTLACARPRKQCVTE